MGCYVADNIQLGIGDIDPPIIIDSGSRCHQLLNVNVLLQTAAFSLISLFNVQELFILLNFNSANEGGIASDQRSSRQLNNSARIRLRLRSDSNNKSSFCFLLWQPNLNFMTVNCSYVHKMDSRSIQGL